MLGEVHLMPARGMKQQSSDGLTLYLDSSLMFLPVSGSQSCLGNRGNRGWPRNLDLWILWKRQGILT